MGKEEKIKQNSFPLKKVAEMPIIMIHTILLNQVGRQKGLQTQEIQGSKKHGFLLFFVFLLVLFFLVFYTFDYFNFTNYHTA